MPWMLSDGPATGSTAAVSKDDMFWLLCDGPAAVSEVTAAYNQHMTSMNITRHALTDW